MPDEVMNVNGCWLELTHSEQCAFASSCLAISVTDACTATTFRSVFTWPSI